MKMFGWAESEIIDKLRPCFAHYDADDIKKALEHTKLLFTKLARICAKKYAYISGVGAVDSR